MDTLTAAIAFADGVAIGVILTGLAAFLVWILRD